MQDKTLGNCQVLIISSKHFVYLEKGFGPNAENTSNLYDLAKRCKRNVKLNHTVHLESILALSDSRFVSLIHIMVIIAYPRQRVRPKRCFKYTLIKNNNFCVLFECAQKGLS